MGATTIQWCDHSINPFKARNKETGKIGHFCVKLTAGCKNCYSSKMQNPFLTQLEFVAPNRPKVELFLDDHALNEVLRRRKPTKYFWCDMTDMFLEDYPDEWIAQCFAVMAITHWHTHLVLTKRTSRLRDLMNSADFRDQVSSCIDITAMSCCDPNDRRSDDLRATAPDVMEDWPLPNIWLGTSVEDQPTADVRIPHLLQTPAAIRFISYEPALAEIDITEYLRFETCGGGRRTRNTRLDQVICGGESVPGARPFDIAWARSVIRQCREAGRACFVKQLGANPQEIASPRDVTDTETTNWMNDRWTRITDENGQHWRRYLKLKDSKGGDWTDPNFPEDLKVREFPEVPA